MKRIENAVIIGMGALGQLFGQRICENLPDGSMCFLMDAERKRGTAGTSIPSMAKRFPSG